MLQFAHRGCSDECPENTMKAFKKAFIYPYDGIETDIQMTRDGQLVLCHDYKINRTSNGKGYIKDMTYEQLLQYDFGEGEKIPLLKELLELTKDKDILLNLELKEDVPEDMVKKVAEIVKDYDLSKILFSSTSLSQMLEMKEYYPDSYCAIICVRHFRSYKKNLYENNIDGIHSKYSYLNDKEITDIYHHHKKIGAWTITKQTQYESLKHIDILFTNHYFKEEL